MQAFQRDQHEIKIKIKMDCDMWYELIVRRCDERFLSVQVSSGNYLHEACGVNRRCLSIQIQTIAIRMSQIKGWVDTTEVLFGCYQRDAGATAME